MKQIRLSKLIPAFIWFIVVLVLVCLPGRDIPKIGWADEIQFDKLVHTGVFGLLALLFMLPVAFSPASHKQKLAYFAWIAIATSIWGITTEFIQRYWVTGRSFDLFDWAADSLGALIAYIFCAKKYFSIFSGFSKYFYEPN